MVDDPESAPPPPPEPAPRRTWLAAERTWLAWWRTALGASAVAVTVGRLLPGLAHGSRWPFRALGIGYALLAVGAVVVGGWRQHRASSALREGRFEELSGGLVLVFTAALVLLALGTLVDIALAL